jgi:hypothetical protein
MIQTRLSLFVYTVIGLALVPAMAEAAQPAKGTYTAYHQRLTATASCAIQAGAVWTSYFFYPGPLANGAVGRLEYDVPTGNALLQINTYSMTPAAAAASWSGTLVETTLPPSSSVTKTFTTNITYGDSKSWLWDRTLTVSTCTAHDSIVLVRTGN